MAAKPMTPVVVDLSHHNEVEDFGKVYASGVRGVIHKATQGGSFVDGDYGTRRVSAQAAGLLWGAYHFADSSDVERQVENFLSAIGDPSGMLLALDWEELYDSKGRRAKSKEMTLAQVKQWLQLVYERTGQRPILYSGSLIKETLNGKADPTLSAHRLWLAQYGSKAVLPPGFASYWLWQYAADGYGPLPHEVPGITSKTEDLNVFGGSDLASEWGHYPDAPAPTPVPGREDATVADLKGQSRGVDMLVTAKKVAGLLVGGSLGAGTVSDAVAPPPPVVIPDSVLDQLTVENMDKIRDHGEHTRAFIGTMKGLVGDILPALKSLIELLLTFAQFAMMHGWLLGALAGVVVFMLCDLLLGWKLEDYIFGRYTPSRAG